MQRNKKKRPATTNCAGLLIQLARERKSDASDTGFRQGKSALTQPRRFFPLVGVVLTRRIVVVDSVRIALGQRLLLVAVRRAVVAGARTSVADRLRGERGRRGPLLLLLLLRPLTPHHAFAHTALVSGRTQVRDTVLERPDVAITGALKRYKQTIGQTRHT